MDLNSGQEAQGHVGRGKGRQRLPGQYPWPTAGPTGGQAAWSGGPDASFRLAVPAFTLRATAAAAESL